MDTQEIPIADLSTRLHIAVGFERDGVPLADINAVMDDECADLAKQHGSYEKALEHYLSADRYLQPGDVCAISGHELMRRRNYANGKFAAHLNKYREVQS